MLARLLLLPEEGLGYFFLVSSTVKLNDSALPEQEIHTGKER
nr:hypothetical protein [Wolbachia endosymbiont of Litomosoides brasiliensis]